MQEEFLNWLRRKEFWHRSTPSFLARAGVGIEYISAYCELGEPSLPADAIGYLQRSNPRFQELDRRYKEMPVAAISRSQWSPAYVDLDVPFDRFRGDCAFVWQHRDYNLPLTYALTYYYLLAEGFRPILDCLDEDDLFGTYTITVDSRVLSRDRLDSACELGFLHQRLGLDTQAQRLILDIGSGYGRFAHRATQAFAGLHVACADAIPESSFLCEYYLRFRGATRAQMVPLFDLVDWLHNHRVDIAINVHSFSECSRNAIEWWVALLSTNSVPYLLIVPNKDRHAGDLLLSKEADGRRYDFTDILGEHGYRLMTMEPKYRDPFVQQYGVSPTYYHVYALS